MFNVLQNEQWDFNHGKDKLNVSISTLVIRIQMRLHKYCFHH